MGRLLGARILVVEDDLAMLEITCDIFEGEGAVVKSATNGKEAWEVLQSSEFDLIVSDVQMPVMSGVELLDKVRQRDPKIPVFLLVTGHADVQEKDAIKRGAAGIIHKPFEMESFIIRAAAVTHKKNTA